MTLHGAGGVANALRVLNAMGVRSSAVVDLDFVARDGVKAKLIQRDHAALVELREISTRRHKELKFAVSGDGFPKKSASGTAEEGFAKLATDDDAAEQFDQLRAELVAHRIWTWPRGPMEHHMRIQHKSPEGVADLLIRLRESGKDSGIDSETVEELLRFALGEQ